MANTPKLDLKREHRSLYNPSQKGCFIVDVPDLRYLMIDGAGDPNTAQAYQDAVTALYGMAYTLKFRRKSEGHDFVVMPLEGLWWADDPTVFRTDRSAWQWTLMILMPDSITQSHFDMAADELRKKKDPVGLDVVRLATLAEGQSVQIMHIGPYADEEPTIDRLHTFAYDNGFELRDNHHEIYLSDPRRAAPEKLKTIIRHPVRLATA